MILRAFSTIKRRPIALDLTKGWIKLAENIDLEHSLSLVEHSRATESQQVVQSITNTLMQRCWKENRFTEACKLYPFAPKDAPPETMLWLFKSASGTLSRINLAVRMSDEYFRTEAPPLFDGLNLIRTLCQTSRPFEAQRVLFNFGRMYPAYFNAGIFHAIAIGFRNSFSVDGLHMFLKELERQQLPIPPKTLALALDTFMSHHCKNKFDYWSTIASPRLNIEIAQVFLVSAIRSGSQNKFDRVLADIKERNLSWKISTFEMCIKEYLDMGMIERASDLFAEMQKKHQATSSHYALFIKYYVLTENWKEIDNLWPEIKRDPTDDALDIMLQAAIQQGAKSRIFEIYEMFEPQIHMKTHRRLVGYYLNTQQFAIVDKLVDTLPNSKMTSLKAISDVISYHAARLNVKQAGEYLEKLLDSFGKNLLLYSACAFAPLIRAYGKMRVRGQVEKYWYMMKSRHIVLDARAYGSLISAYADLELHQTALDVLEKYRESGRLPNQGMVRTELVIFGHLGREKEMLAKYKFLTKNKQPPDQAMSNLTALMSGYAALGNWQKALEIWERMFRIPVTTGGSFGVTPATVCVILDTLGRFKQTDSLLHVWNVLKESKYPLVENNYCSMLEALVKCNQHEKAQQLLDQLTAQTPNGQLDRKALWTVRMLNSRRNSSP